MDNLFLPGNLRYQPKEMIPYFGYDNLYKTFVDVEMATLEVLHDIKVIPDDEYAKITVSIKKQLQQIKTTQVDKLERAVTKHDIRALVKSIQEVIRSEINRWAHVPLTSYDVIDTGRSMTFFGAYEGAIKPALLQVISLLSSKVIDLAYTKQIGRTHGQHALPITVGFWLATVLNRWMYNYYEMERFVNSLVGKISGAVGAYNAQIGLGLSDDTGDFEKKVLAKLAMKPAAISTQILPPEPLAYFLHSCVMMSASLGQFGRDGRNLMRTEIAEIREAFEDGQVGSSTMAHKRNPVNFENLEGFYWKTKNEYGKVLDALISDHQRDLVGSCIARDFPIILINLQHQLNTLLRKGKNGIAFLTAITVDEESCQRNLNQSAGLVIAEPLYIALQMAGYTGDAHELVNKQLMPVAKGKDLLSALLELTITDHKLKEVVDNIPEKVMELLQNPSSYTGAASSKALLIAEEARKLVVHKL